MTYNIKTLSRPLKIIAIVPAAGLGKRFGPGANKPFLRLGGRPLIVWSLETLESIPGIVEIIPALKPDDMDEGLRIFEEYGLKKIKRIAAGGKERQDSIYSCLKLIQDTACIVLVHDGVRPLIEKGLIENAIGELADCDGVVLGVPVKDTIKEVRDMVISKTLKRDSIWAVQTPQIFPYSIISRAYEKAMRDGHYSTDDSALVERNGGKVKIVMGSYGNIKITTPEDLHIAEALLKVRSEQ
jgi:2-C-methyl-D-erythritol 4-phosphate cytidylyltransferase